MVFRQKKVFLIVMVMVMVMVMTVMTGKIAASDRTITDNAGREIKVPADPESIVALGPGALRLVVYLQAQDRVVGVEDFEKKDNKRPYILAHPELAELPSVGPQFGGEPELITAQNPDLILQTYTTTREARTLQKKTGIPVAVLVEGGAGTMYLEQLEQALGLAARLLNKEDRAQSIIEFYKKRVSDLKQKTRDIDQKDRQQAYIGGIGQKGAKGLTSTEPAYPPFSYINVDNVAGEIGQTYSRISPEKLLEWDPTYLFIDEGGYSLALADLEEKKFSSLSSVQNRRVFGVLPYNYYSTNFGTLLANSYFIGKTIYPEPFSDIEPKKVSNEIYKFFVGKEVYSQMSDIFGGFQDEIE
ncbi:MAG: iron ABC transporter substrate-binding protein [Bacillota bacterium]